MGRFLYDLRGFAASGALYGLIYAALHGLLVWWQVAMFAAIGCVAGIAGGLLRRGVDRCAAMPPHRRANLYRYAGLVALAGAAVAAGVAVYDMAGRLLPAVLAVTALVLSWAAVVSAGRAALLRQHGNPSRSADPPPPQDASHWLD